MKLIKRLRGYANECGGGQIEADLNEAILATLQSIKDAGDDVVEPSTVGFIRARAENGNKEDASVAEFIDTLLSAYKRVCAEKDQALRVFKIATDEVIRQAQRAEKAEAERDEFRKDAEDTRNEWLSVQRKMFEELNHPNPPTSSQWEAIRVEARKQIAAIDSARNK